MLHSYGRVSSGSAARARGAAGNDFCVFLVLLEHDSRALVVVLVNATPLI